MVQSEDQFSTCLNSLSLQLEISYGWGTNRNGKECSSWHDDKRILSVAGVILDIVRDAETISVTLTRPFCSLSLLSQWWFHSHSRCKNIFLYIHDFPSLFFSFFLTSKYYGAETNWQKKQQQKNKNPAISKLNEVEVFKETRQFPTWKWVHEKRF